MSLNPKIPSWSGRRVWLLGASSGIGRATASALHAQGAHVVVSARGEKALASFVTSHPGSQAVALDVTQGDAIKAAAAQLLASGPLDLVFYCAGTYQDLRATEFDLEVMLNHMTVNYTGAVRVLDAVLPSLLAQSKRGAPAHFSVISSVAGFGGLPKSLAYGPTKAALINLAETLYLDLHDLGVGVSLVNPGFVDTPLTASNDFAMPALTSPEDAAQAILKGWERGDFEVHFPKRFTRIMKLLKFLPYRAYFPAVRRFTGM